MAADALRRERRLPAVVAERGEWQRASSPSRRPPSTAARPPRCRDRRCTMSASTVMVWPTTRLIGKAPPSTDGVMRSIAMRGAFRASVRVRPLRRARSATGCVRATARTRTSPDASSASRSSSSSGRASSNGAPAAGGSGSSGGGGSAVRVGVDENDEAALGRSDIGRIRRSSIDTGSPAPVRLRISPPATGVRHVRGQTIGRRDVFAEIEGRARCDPRAKSSGVPRCGSSRRRAPNSKPMGTNRPWPVAAATRRACT